MLPSQLNPSSTVINHLLVGRKPRSGGSGYPNTDTSTLLGTRPSSVFQGRASPSKHHRGSLPSIGTGSPGSSRGGGGSPWRTHVRLQRRSLARARAKEGFGDSEEREDDEEVEKRIEEEQKDRSDPSATGPNSEEIQQDLDETREAKVEEVVGQLEALELEDINPETEPPPPEAAPVSHVPLLPPPPPSSRRLTQSDSSSSEHASSPNRHFPTIPLTPPNPSVRLTSSSTSTPSPGPSPVPTSAHLQPSPSTPSSSSAANSLSSLHPSSFYKTPSPSTPSLSSLSSSSHMSLSPSSPAFPSPGAVPPKQQVFSPFPCVKQPRKSVAARNLGLYGPTSRTPTVHFPQLSRNLNRSSGAGTTERR